MRFEIDTEKKTVTVVSLKESAQLTREVKEAGEELSDYEIIIVEADNDLLPVYTDDIEPIITGVEDVKVAGHYIENGEIKRSGAT